MISKYLHDRREYDSFEGEADSGRGDKVTLEYYVVEDDGEYATLRAAERDSRYGLMVVMNRSRMGGEQRTLRDVTPSEAVARKYARILAEHCVTPCAMVDVMEDLVAVDASL